MRICKFGGTGVDMEYSRRKEECLTPLSLEMFVLLCCTLGSLGCNDDTNQREGSCDTQVE